MDCSQILPGAVNPGCCSLATGCYLENPFIVYASGKDVVILDGKLKHIQTVLGSDCGYGDTRINCVHCAELVGKIAVAWGSDVVIFEPEPLEETSGSNEFPGDWRQTHTFTLDYPVLSLCWHREGSQLLIGGRSVVLLAYEGREGGASPTSFEARERGEGEGGSWREVWRCGMAVPVVHLKLSPDGAMFTTAGENDRLVKIWSLARPGVKGVGSGEQLFSFIYIAHPRAVTGFVWRKTSPFMPRGCVANVLLTYCKDNICRLWSHAISTERKNRLRFFIAASIDPVADIPFRTTMPIENMPFIVHWLNNKETTFTSKAEKTQKGYTLPLSRHSSLASFASSINEEMLQSWVCIEDGGQDEHSSDPQSSDTTGSSANRKAAPHVYSFSNFLSITASGHAKGSHRGASPHHEGSRMTASMKLFAQLLDGWVNSPDLLLCIHPSNGSLMVWTVEGLDAPYNSAKLVHVSFSSCLPHIFPPHLAQSLRQELLQFLIKEPDVVQTREIASAGSYADISYPVPQINLPSGGSMAEVGKENIPKTKPDSTLILVSSHLNGSLNTWSVELTVQSRNCTSIAGLIHFGETGGHHSEIQAVHRHPWLPVLMTVSSDAGSGKKSNGVESELIIWNADLPGPLKHKSRLNELCRMSSPDPFSFQHVIWIPPISVGSPQEGAFARSPSSGLFIANIGNELRLYQTSLYCMTQPQQTNLQTSSAPSNVTDGPAHDLSAAGSQKVTITSQLGKEGISFISVIEKDLSQFEQIVSIHTFRMCSLVTSFDIKKSLDSKFCKDVVVAMVENRTLKSPSPGSKSTKSYLHLWRIVVCSHTTGMDSPVRNWAFPPLGSDSHLKRLQPVIYTATVEKVYMSPIPLPSGVHTIGSTPACDLASSLQLQLPTLSAPYLFATACSDGTIRFWQFTVERLDSDLKSNDITPSACACEEEKQETLMFELYEVFGASGLEESDSIRRVPKCLDCYEAEVLRSLPTVSYIPTFMCSAYPGRFAMAHHLSRPADSSTSQAKFTVNPLGKYAAVTVWECESSGGLKWSCEATLILSGLGVVTSKSAPLTVLLEWLPMENGAYLLATCFSSIISIFGMALPRAEGQYTTLDSSRMSGFLPAQKSAMLSDNKSQASWICLLQFPCAKPYPGLSISCFSYTGSNSLLISIGSEMHLYSCWIKGNRLEAFTPSKEERKLVSKTPSRVFREASPGEGTTKLTDTDIINMLDYAHARNTPLPQYHPKILTELMNSGNLRAVKTILVNLVKYLMLYQEKQKKLRQGYFDEEGSFGLRDEDMETEEEESRPRVLSVSAEGHLRRSRRVKAKIRVESIPPLSLSKLGIFGKREAAEQPQQESDAAGQGEDEYDELFSTSLGSPLEEFTYGFETETKDLTFSDLDPETSNFTPQMAQKLSTILHYAQLADLSDLEQVRALAIAETVANTKMSFSDQTGTQEPPASTSVGMSIGTFSTSGAGYASSGLTHGVRGGEAMDDCGLRYLLALENYVTLSNSLPEDISPASLSPSEVIWAFHSDAEMELLSAIPCVQKDELSWAELRNAGVGWWLRSSDSLRRLVEKLAKTQFMQNQEPLDASLFYLAMKKKSLVKGLFKTVREHRMTVFFSNDFSQERWRKAALKNAFVLLGKQRFEHAAAFFLLADKLWDAVEVCVSRLGDLQLAFVITRLYEGDGGPIYERLLKEEILGISTGSDTPLHQIEASPNSFLRSIACWLLQDYSGALETLLMIPTKTVKVQRRERSEEPDSSSSLKLDPAIFHFYFFLRSHPLLLRRDYSSQAGKSLFQTTPSHSRSSQAYGHPLSGVGDGPLTPTERSLLFTAAYHHLSHGCPLLALDVLSRLPKSRNLGTELSEMSSKEGPSIAIQGSTTPSNRDSMIGMIQSGTLGDFAFGGGPTSVSKSSSAIKVESEDEFDWSQPISSQLGGMGMEEEDIDWSQPVSTQVGGGADLEDEFDWSKPVSTQLLQPDDEEEDEIDWSKPVSSQKLGISSNISPSSPEDEPRLKPVGGGKDDDDTSKSTLSTWGLFILSLAEQLQYNACLSILTEELNTIFIPACCQYLWETKGKQSLPLLPLTRRSGDKDLALHFRENAFEKTVLNLRGMLVEWLRSETKTVKEICGFELVEEDPEEQPESTSPAGYDLLTTLMNYTALHADTSPSLLTVKLELMHLMNTLLPWSTGLTQVLQDLDVDTTTHVPTCAVDPEQLPILTSCSLPAKHLTNLALHLRLMCASIVEMLASHVQPPILSKPLPNIHEVFELCCAISHCLTVCLSPMRLADIAGTVPTSSAYTQSQSKTSEQKSAPTSKSPKAPMTNASPHLSSRPRSDSDSAQSTLDFLQKLENPNTKPSKWPGVAKWPNSLSSDEGKDPTPLSLVLVECCVAVYVGLLSVAWSWHSITDLLLLLKNAPSQEMWYSAFGGGIDVKKGDEKGRRTASKSMLMQKAVDAMTKRFKILRRSSTDVQGEGSPSGFFITPKRTLLDHYLSLVSSNKEGVEELFPQDWDTREREGRGREEEEEEEEEREFYFEQGPTFRLGSVSQQEEEGQDYENPDSFPWCLMNLCITRLVREAIQRVLSTAGLEVLELVTASPLLYSALKVVDEWESIFARRLDALGAAPDDLFHNEEEESSMFPVGPALIKHKFILEPDNSPFRSKSKPAKQARQLWEYLVHQDEVRETFIHYIFCNKHAGSVADVVPTLRILHKEADDPVSCFCINSANPNVFALAVGREILEIDVPDTTILDSMPIGDDISEKKVPRRSHSLAAGTREEFVMVQAASQMPRSPSYASQQYVHGLHTQTGSSSSILLKRNILGVKRMAPHPSLSYYLTGSMDGSLVMWEFGTPRQVLMLRAPGSAPGITRIRFTPQGNKYGVTDVMGKLSLWQGIHTSTKTPYQTLISGMRYLNDFQFLGSSSFIAACGDASDGKNVCLWDTLLPPKSSIVREYMCHEGGATALGYSQSKQRLFCGGKKGEICIFDIRQCALLQCIPLHNTAVNSIVVNDVDGYFVAGSVGGDIKVLDVTTVSELASFPGEHAKSRLTLFRYETGVTDMSIAGGKLYSSGADGTIKCRTLADL